MTTTLYGIPNCDTMKKARAWLDKNGVSYTFYDVKKSGIDLNLINTWLRDVTWDILVNRKGTTWRALSDGRKASIQDDVSAVQLMLESPSVIKRPVMVTASHTYVGFSEETYQQIFKK